MVICLEPSITKMLQVGSLQPPGHDIGNFLTIIYKSNDPQIFHLQNKLLVYKLFVRLGYLVGCTQNNISPDVLQSKFYVIKMSFELMYRVCDVKTKLNASSSLFNVTIFH